MRVKRLIIILCEFSQLLRLYLAKDAELSVSLPPHVCTEEGGCQGVESTGRWEDQPVYNNTE